MVKGLGTWVNYCCWREGRFDTGSRPSVVAVLIQARLRNNRVIKKTLQNIYLTAKRESNSKLVSIGSKIKGWDQVEKWNRIKLGMPNSENLS